MSKKVRSTVTGLLSISMALSSLGVVNAAQKGNDLEGHWAQTQIQNWINSGNLNGYEDGTVKPNKSISRAEFIALINRSFGYSETSEISFEDLASTSWAYTDISKAVQAGYVQGYENNTFRPGANVTRQEAAVMISKILGVQNSNYDVLNQFVDRDAIAGWSKAAVASVIEQEVMKGYPNDTFAPLRSLTRAEAVVLIDNALASKKELSTTTYDQAGIYGSETEETVIEGNVIINVPGVTLQNTVIKGDLLFAEGIGAGDVTIKNVKVHGTTNVEGGGENSIHLVDSVLLNIIVNKKDGTVRIVAEGTTTTQSVVVKSSVKLEEDNATSSGFTDVELSKELPKDSKVVLNGTFDDVDIYAASMSVELARGSIENMQIDRAAKDNAITISSNAKVVQLVLDAITKLLGSGTVSKAIINDGAAGSSFQSKPVQLDGVQKDNVTIPVAPPVSSGGGSGTSSGGGDTTPAPVEVDKLNLLHTLSAARELNKSVQVGTEKGEVDQASKNVFTSAIADADLVYIDSSATQKAVDQASTKLATAMKVFESAIIKEDNDQNEEIKAEKQQLFSIILGAKNLNDHVSVGEKPGDVSQSAKDQFIRAINVAEAVYADETVKVATVIFAQGELGTAITAFQNAIIKEDSDQKEEIKAEKQQLFSIILGAKNLNDHVSVGEKAGDVSQSAKDEFTNAINVAEAVYADETIEVAAVISAQGELGAAITAFQNAIIKKDQGESEVEIAKQALFNTIGEAKEINSAISVGDNAGQVSQSAKDQFEDAISVAESVYTNETSSVIDVNVANENLNASIEEFNAAVITEEQKEAEAIQAAKFVLYSTIESAERLNDQYAAGTQIGQVPAEEKEVFENTISVSRDVYDNLEATLTVVKTANTDLQTAMENFEASVIKEVEVATVAELRAAVTVDNNKIKLTGNIVVDNEGIDVGGQNVIINGNGHSISWSDDTNSRFIIFGNNVSISNVTIENSMDFNLQVYNAKDVVLENVTLNNSLKGGLLVNGSTVTVRNITTSNNGWGGIEVSKGAGLNLTDSVLTVEGTSVHSENVAIWTVNTDGANNVVTEVTEQYRSYADARPNKQGYTNYVLKNAYQTVNKIEEFKLAVSIDENKVRLGSDLVGAESVRISGANVEIHGASHSISITGEGNKLTVENNGVKISDLTVKDSTEYNLHVYNARDVVIENVILNNSKKGGLLVNGSTVTVRNITTSKNNWGGIEVSKGSAENLSASTLTVEGTNKHSEDVAIWTVNPNNDGNTVVDGANQYHASADTRQGKEGYTNYKAYQVVNTFEELSEAVKVDNNKIKLGTSIIETGKLLEVKGSNIVIEGNGKTLSLKEAGNSFLIFGSGTKVMNLIVANSAGYNVQVYKATSVAFDNVTLEGAKSGGLLVNGASVTVNNIRTKGNVWGGIEVSKGIEVQEQPSLTITGTSAHDEAVAIWIDPKNGNSNPIVNDIQNQYDKTDATEENKEGFKYFTLKNTSAE